MIYIVSPFENHIESRGTRNLSLYKELISLDNCKIITTNFSHQNKKKVEASSFSNSFYDYVVFNVPVYKSNLSLIRFFTHQVFALKLFFHLMFNVKDGDSIILSSIPPESVFACCLVKKLKKKIRLVLDVRDIWPDALPLGGMIKKLFSTYCYFLYILNKSTIDEVTYVSPAFKNKWINRYVGKDKGVFVPLGFDDERWNKAKEWLSNHSYPLLGKNNKINLIYIGYLQSQFPLDVIIASVSQCDNFQLHIVGDGDMREKYESNNPKNVFFYGNLPLYESSLVVSSCDIGVLPILGNAQMPNKLFDYLGASLPTLVIGENDSSKFVEENNIGWCSKFDESEVNRFLLALDSNEIMTKRKSVFSIRSNFSKEKQYNKFVKLVG
ncbi:glycosyltransferase family 4 protein [Vibrio diabolicus]|uniref:glycosyltransferase family 4 protein n=1 Tax=Vibrio diabolicus TaxID=50719 RepID=UPI00375042B1